MNETRTATVGPQIDFDVVTEVGFADRTAYDAWWKEMGEGGGEKIEKDAGRFWIMTGRGPLWLWLRSLGRGGEFGVLIDNCSH